MFEFEVARLRIAIDPLPLLGVLVSLTWITSATPWPRAEAILLLAAAVLFARRDARVRNAQGRGRSRAGG